MRIPVDIALLAQEFGTDEGAMLSALVRSGQKKSAQKWVASRESTKKMLSLAKEGASLEEISAGSGYAQSTVVVKLNAAGIKIKNRQTKHIWTWEELAELLGRNLSGESYAKLAENWKCEVSTIAIKVWAAAKEPNLVVYLKIAKLLRKLIESGAILGVVEKNWLAINPMMPLPSRDIWGELRLIEIEDLEHRVSPALYKRIFREYRHALPEMVFVKFECAPARFELPYIRGPGLERIRHLLRTSVSV